MNIITAPFAGVTK